MLWLQGGRKRVGLCMSYGRFRSFYSPAISGGCDQSTGDIPDHNECGATSTFACEERRKPTATRIGNVAPKDEERHQHTARLRASKSRHGASVSERTGLHRRNHTSLPAWLSPSQKNRPSRADYGVGVGAEEDDKMSDTKRRGDVLKDMDKRVGLTPAPTTGLRELIPFTGRHLRPHSPASRALPGVS